MKAAILLVEDDEFFARVVKRHLERADHEVIHCLNGQEGWETYQDHTFDLCILDIVMPKMDGFQLTQKIRSHNENIPIIFSSARYQEQDRIYGFEIGGDDYMIKPFNLVELLMRIEVFLKRSRLLQSDRKLTYNMGELTFDYSELRIFHTASSLSIQLPPKEADLLRFLCEHANKKLTREFVLTHVWGINDFFAGRSMDVYLTRLRKHFSLDPIIRLESFHSKGLMLVLNT
ncbi:response regulator transcription factor [Chitinophaga defluvii]|uniref:Response regulator transcription factor n=1 Tax=Chitinophaga defluvii TaxID=3163343 RepID=A0ABV2TDG5_9BACT